MNFNRAYFGVGIYNGKAVSVAGSIVMYDRLIKQRKNND